jgi:hypothetical protein
MLVPFPFSVPELQKGKAAGSSEVFPIHFILALSFC